MTDPSVWCAAISGLSAVLCAVVAAKTGRQEKENKAQQDRVEARAAQRAKEGRLQLAMLNANSQLTVGVAMALKRGHCNGEVESGLEAVQKTTREYEAFLEGIAVEHLTREGR